MTMPCPPASLVEQHDDRPRLQPRHRYIAVRMEQPEEYRTLLGGVIIPTGAQPRREMGTVVACGSEAEFYQPGDQVLFPEASGQDIELTGTQYRLLPDHEILGKVKKSTEGNLGRGGPAVAVSAGSSLPQPASNSGVPLS